MKGLFRNGEAHDVEASDAAGAEHGLLSIDSALFKDVRVVLQARLGEITLSVGELLALKSGSLLKLETGMNEEIEILLNESVVAWGEIVAVDDKFGVRIVEVARR